MFLKAVLPVISLESMSMVELVLMKFTPSPTELLPDARFCHLKPHFG